MYILTILFICFSLATAQYNYQQRRLYYSESDNACSNRDKINLIINVDDSGVLKTTIDGGTSCSGWYIRAAMAITTTNSTQFKEYNSSSRDYYHDIRFAQEVTHKYTFGVLSDITQNVTVLTFSTIYNKLHNCTILGDGHVQHFGVDDPKYTPAQIYMRCVSNKVPSSKSSIQSNQLAKQ